MSRFTTYEIRWKYHHYSVQYLKVWFRKRFGTRSVKCRLLIWIDVKLRCRPAWWRQFKSISVTTPSLSGRSNESLNILYFCCFERTRCFVIQSHQPIVFSAFLRWTWRCACNWMPIALHCCLLIQASLTLAFSLRCVDIVCQFGQLIKCLFHFIALLSYYWTKNIAPSF